MQEQRFPREGRISFTTKIAYGSGDVACNIVYGMISTLLVLFYTDYAGVSPYLVGIVMMLSRIFDGVSDVIMGYIVSKTHSRWGQSRPWIIWMAAPYALGAVLLFTVPHTGEMLQFIYMFITYNFCTTVCYTAINLPYGSLSAMMTRDSGQRDMLSVFRMGMSPIGRIIAVTFTLPLVKAFGNDHSKFELDRGAGTTGITGGSFLKDVMIVIIPYACIHQLGVHCINSNRRLRRRWLILLW